MIYLFVFIVISLVTILVYGLYISYKKINIYETFILNRRERYKELFFRIKQIDSKEIFEKDDEVGVIFSEIKTEIEEFENFLK